MIYTVTFNPAIDYIVRMPEFIAGATNRVNYEQVLGGGKGINVSIVLKNLGIDSTALGFISGFTGKEIIRQLHSFGCKSDFIELPNGFSRINVKIKTNDEETEVNGQGPDIPANAIEELFAKLDKLTAGDTLVLAGSIPKTLPDDIYEKIMARLENRNINIVVDATKNLLLNVLKYRPFLIKPNNHELAEMFNVTLTCNDDIITYAKKLQDMGAKNVLVSMGKDGAILVAEDGSITYSPVPKGKLVNSIGAGDSMVAGFLTGYIETNDEETEVNGQGPDIPANAIEELFAKLDKLTAGDTLVLAGSIPKTLPDDIYEKIMARLENRNINIVVDATKNLLLNVLKYRPFLIKPNNHELAEMFNVTLTCNDDIITYAKKLQDMGAKNVLVSMGKDGAILVAEDGSITYSPVPKGKLVNSIGAGDSMVAGFLTGYIETNSYEKAFYMGVATGSASAFSENLATRSEVEALLKTLNN